MTWKRSDGSRRSTWTKADIRAARLVPLKPVLEELGYQLIAQRNGNYLVCRLATEIVIKDNYWVCKDPGTAQCVRKTCGNAIDFLVEVERMSFNQAMELLVPYTKNPS